MTRKGKISALALPQTVASTAMLHRHVAGRSKVATFADALLGFLCSQ